MVVCGVWWYVVVWCVVVCGGVVCSWYTYVSTCAVLLPLQAQDLNILYPSYCRNNAHSEAIVSDHAECEAFFRVPKLTIITINDINGYDVPTPCRNSS